MKNNEKCINQIEEPKKRSQYWDIVKSIGIISIVIGHTTASTILHDFVYTYHLAIFYFVAIFFYNESKYGDKPFQFFGVRLKGVWIKYMFYCIIMILLHNFFVRYCFCRNQPYYTNIGFYLDKIFNTVVMCKREYFSGALWFVPTLIETCGIFAGIVYVSRRISKILYEKKFIKYISIIVLSIMLGAAGVYLNEHNTELSYHSHTVLLIIPICASAYFFSIALKYEKVKKWISKIYIAVPLAVISGLFIYFMVKQGKQIELSQEKIVNWYMFYIISIIGIIFCLSLSKILEKIPIINEIFSTIGEHSFAIMGLHFMCVKTIDVLYAHMINETDPEVIAGWPNTYPDKLFWIYLLIGVFVPVAFSICLSYFKTSMNKIENRIVTKQKNRIN